MNILLTSVGRRVELLKSFRRSMYQFNINCITVQCFLQPDGEIIFIEINPRFGGGYPLSYRAGADFPSWLMQLYMGEHPQVAIDEWEDGLAMLRYDDAIFVKANEIGIKSQLTTSNKLLEHIYRSQNVSIN